MAKRTTTEPFASGFAKIPRETLFSREFQALSPGAQSLWMYYMAMVWVDEQSGPRLVTDRKHAPMGFRARAEAVGRSQSRVMRQEAELAAVGLLSVVASGGQAGFVTVGVSPTEPPPKQRQLWDEGTASETEAVEPPTASETEAVDIDNRLRNGGRTASETEAVEPEKPMGPMASLPPVEGVESDVLVESTDVEPPTLAASGPETQVPDAANGATASAAHDAAGGGGVGDSEDTEAAMTDGSQHGTADGTAPLSENVGDGNGNDLAAGYRRFLRYLVENHDGDPDEWLTNNAGALRAPMRIRARGDGLVDATPVDRARRAMNLLAGRKADEDETTEPDPPPGGPAQAQGGAQDAPATSEQVHPDGPQETALDAPRRSETPAAEAIRLCWEACGQSGAVPTGKGYPGLVLLHKEHGGRFLRLAAHWRETGKRPEAGANPWAWFKREVRAALNAPFRWDPTEQKSQRRGPLPPSSGDDIQVDKWGQVIEPGYNESATPARRRKTQGVSSNFVGGECTHVLDGRPRGSQPPSSREEFGPSGPVDLGAETASERRRRLIQERTALYDDLREGRRALTPDSLDEFRARCSHLMTLMGIEDIQHARIVYTSQISELASRLQAETPAP